MRTRTIVLVVAILLVAGFAALNWTEMVRPSTLMFGPIAADVPLGLTMLVLLAVTLVLFLASSLAMRAQSLMDYRQHQKTLEAQRDLADRAEASRFVDLRQHLDTHLKDMRERDAIAASEFDKAMLQSRRELQVQMEQINRTISARLTEIEARLDSRFDRIGMPLGAASVPPVQESMAARDARIREEERLRQDRRDDRAVERDVQDEVQREERAAAAGKPSESGWRKWF